MTSDSKKDIPSNQMAEIIKAQAHPWPALGYVLVGLAALSWAWYTPLETKIRCFFGASCFSLIEFTFYTLTVELPNGDIVFRPFDKKCRKGHTTPHQWFANVLTLPFLLDAYFAYITSPWLRILLWPINIWTLEVVQGYSFIYLYGYNPAWMYFGSDALFHGNVKLGYWVFWLPMGVFMQYLGWDLVLLVSRSIAQVFI